MDINAVNDLVFIAKSADPSITGSGYTPTLILGYLSDGNLFKFTKTLPTTYTDAHQLLFSDFGSRIIMIVSNMDLNM